MINKLFSATGGVHVEGRAGAGGSLPNALASSVLLESCVSENVLVREWCTLAGSGGLLQAPRAGAWSLLQPRREGEPLPST